MKFSSRQMAIDAGMKHYVSGKKCKYNHPDVRYARSGVCVECHRMRSKNNAEAVRRAYINVGLGLKTPTTGVHPDDLETAEAFLKALLFDRGIY